MTLLKFLGICVVGMALSLPAYADRGSAAYKKGTRAERQANLDAAYGFYNQAHTLSPRNAKYFMASTQMRFKAGNEHVHNGQLLRNTGRLAQTRAVGGLQSPEGTFLLLSGMRRPINPSPGPRRLVKAPSRSTLSRRERAVRSVLPCSSTAVSSPSGTHHPLTSPHRGGSADLRS